MDSDSKTTKDTENAAALARLAAKAEAGAFDRLLHKATYRQTASLHETLDVLSDDETLNDLRQSLQDFTHGDAFDAEEVRAELARRRREAP